MNKSNEVNTIAGNLLGDLLDHLESEWFYVPKEKTFIRLRKLSKLMAIELCTPQVDDEEEIEEPYGDMDQFGGDEHGIVNFVSKSTEEERG